MKKIFTAIIALVVCSMMSWATPTIIATDLDFGNVVLNGKDVYGEKTLTISWEDLPLWSQVEVEVLNQPEENCFFAVDENDKTYIWTGSGEDYDPFITSYDCSVSYLAEAIGNYACNIHIYVYDPDDYEVILVEKTINVTLAVTNEATAVDQTAVKVKARKYVQDGQLVIEKNGALYNVLGTKL